MNLSSLTDAIWIWLQNLSPTARMLLILIVYVTVGLALEEFADLFRSSLGRVQPWDPSSGWNVVLLLCLGLRYTPALFIVAFFEDVIDIVIKNQNDNLIESLVSGILITVIYGITAAIFKYKLDFNPDLRRQKDVFQFGVYWTIATLITALLMYVVLYLFGTV